jgi:sugar O-acyltransferase (sialic acid O-acetyltransferase NeuD family)
MNLLPQKLALIGYSGHSFVCADIALTLGMRLVGYFDTNKKDYNPFDLEYLGSEKDASKDTPLFISIGDNHSRKNVFDFCTKSSLYLVNSLLDPTAVVSRSVSVGQGTLVAPRAVINAFSIFGRGCIINSGAIVEHECKIGNFTHIAPGAILAGNVHVGDSCFIGANSVIKQGISICSYVTIGMGAVVTKNITESGVYIGNPAKKLIK